MDASAALQFAFSGLTIGAIYAFVALGVSIVYTSSGVVNFAQGQFVMVGGMVAAALSASLQMPVLLAMLGGVAAAAAAGALFARFFILPMLPGMPIAGGHLVVLATIVIGAYGFLAWYRENL